MLAHTCTRWWFAMSLRSLLCLSLLSLPTYAEDLIRTHHLGADSAARPKQKDVFASWLGEDTIVYSVNGRVVRYDLRKRIQKWSVQGLYPADWSVARDAKRIVLLDRAASMWDGPDSDHDREDRVVVLDSSSGKLLAQMKKTRFESLVKEFHFIPMRLAVVPDTGQVFLAGFQTYYGPFARVVSPDLREVKGKVRIDGALRNLSISPDGKRITTIASNDAICIRNIETDKEVFFSGKRVVVEPKSISGSVDTPFVSHALHDGKQTLVHAVDNSWGKGDVHITDIKTRKSSKFNARNGHIVMDVDFKRKHIALSGTSENLTILQFDGTEVAHLKSATKGRNGCVSLSPSGKRVAVACYDGTISVFEIR